MKAAYELAPQAVMRAAAWPIDGLTALADPLLARRVQNLAPIERHDPAQDALDELEQSQRLLAQAAQLWQLTLGDRRFRRALALANPELYARLRHTRAPSVWNKRARQLTASLYQHWARACWRCEPCGLWAGASLVTWASTTQLSPSPTRYAVTPDLRPWLTVFKALIATSAYQDAGTFALNPSLSLVAPQTWCFRPSHPADAQVCSFAGSTAMDTLLAALQTQPATSLAVLAQIVGQELHLPAIDVQRQLSGLKQLGVLQGGLHFPVQYETVWEALAQAGALLQTDDAAQWQEHVQQLKNLTQALEHQLADCDAEVVFDAQQAAFAIVVSLATALKLDAPAALRSPLCCDVSLPWQVALGPEVQTPLLALLPQIDLFNAHHEPQAAYDAAYAEQLINPQQRRIPPQRSAHWQAVAAKPQAVPAQQKVLRGWSAALRSGHAPLDTSSAATDQLERPPLGTLVLRMGTVNRYVGLSHEPAIAYGRFGQLFGADHALHRWCNDSLQGLQQQCNVQMAQLVMACDSAPNLLAQPRFTGVPVLDIYSLTHQPHRLSAQGLTFAGQRWRAHLRCQGTDKPVLAMFASPLNIGAHDALFERLLLTGWRVMPTGFNGSTLAFAEELNLPGTTRAVALPQGAVVRPRRIFVGKEACQRLATLPTLQRFALWQRWARDWSLPALITVACDNGPPVALVRDSPLAVEALLRAPGQPYRQLMIEIPPDDGYLTDDQGCRYATELALPFERRDHAWRPAPRRLAADRSAIAERQPALVGA